MKKGREKKEKMKKEKEMIQICAEKSKEQTKRRKIEREKLEK